MFSHTIQVFFLVRGGMGRTIYISPRYYWAPIYVWNTGATAVKTKRWNPCLHRKCTLEERQRIKTQIKIHAEKTKVEKVSRKCQKASCSILIGTAPLRTYVD